MEGLLHLAEMVRVHARLQPDKLAARDSSRSLTFREWDRRANQLANALVAIGLQRGDRVAILAYNCLEWMEIYIGLAKAGLVAVPVNFRLTSPEIRYIVEDADARALIVQHELLGSVEGIRSDFQLPGMHCIHFGAATCPA